MSLSPKMYRDLIQNLQGWFDGAASDIREAAIVSAAAEGKRFLGLGAIVVREIVADNFPWPQGATRGIRRRALQAAFPVGERYLEPGPAIKKARRPIAPRNSPAPPAPPPTDDSFSASLNEFFESEIADLAAKCEPLPSAAVLKGGAA